jgi:uncharacterized protein YjiS (DUF1127 family)
MPPIHVLSEEAPLMSIMLGVVALVMAASGLYAHRTLGEAFSRSWGWGVLAALALLIGTAAPTANDQTVKGTHLGSYASTVSNHPSLKHLAEVQAMDRKITVTEYRRMSDAVERMESAAADRALADIGLNRSNSAE